MSIAPVTFSHKRPSPVHSSTDAYPSPRQSPSMGLNKATMVAVTSAPQWNSEHLPTTSGMQEGGWAATSYDQKPHSPSIHHNHPSGQDSYHCLPSPPHQNYSGMDGDFVATTMSIEPQARHAHTSEQMMLSPEHIGGMTMSMEPSTTAISSPGIMSISDYSSDIGLVDGMGIGDTDTEISRKWRANSDPSVGPYGVTKKMRKRRQFTEPHEANFRCEICGKYFSRIWNYNAHKNTHDPNRLKPHICLMDNCRKQFVRKTDLNRHQQCVHQKLKKFECSLCHNRFARKDTLRRLAFFLIIVFLSYYINRYVQT